MALTPYQKRTRVPENAGGGVTRAVSTNVADWGPAVSQIGQQLERTFGPKLQREAVEKGLADFAANGLGKDENGNYVVPEPMDGGLVYQEAYRQAGRDQFVRATVNDAELALNELYYSDPEAFMRDPAGIRQRAQEYIKGTVEGSPVAVQGQIFDSLTREMRQRDLQASQQGYRREIANQTAAMQSSAADIVGRIQGLAVLEQNEEVSAEIALLQQQLSTTAGQLDMFAPGSSQRYGKIVEEAVGFGSAMRVVLDEEFANSSQLTDLYKISKGAEGEIFGLDYQKLIGLMRPETLQRFQQEVNSLRVAKEREETRIANNGTHLNADISQGSGSLSPKKYSEAVAVQMANRGIDISTPNGLLATLPLVNGEPPDDYYEDMLSQGQRKTGADLNAAAAMFDFLRAVPGADTLETRNLLPNMKPEDIAFYDAYISMRGMMNDEGEPLYDTIAAREAAISLISDAGQQQEGEVRSFLRLDENEFGGMDFTALPVEARGEMVDMVTSLVMNGMDQDRAIETAQGQFTRNWVNDPMTATPESIIEYSWFNNFASGGVGALPVLGPALGPVVHAESGNVVRDPNAPANWVRKEDAVPVIRDLRTNTASQDWITESQDIWIESVDRSKNENLPPLSDLKLGQNIMFVPLGADGMFALAYQRDGETVPYYLKGKDGNRVIYNLGRAAQWQQQRYDDARRDAYALADRVEVPEIPLASGAMPEGISPVQLRSQQEQMALAMKRDRVIENVYSTIGRPTREQFEAAKRSEVELGAGNQTTSAFINGYFQRLAGAESSGNDTARNSKSTATGRFQFVEDTWLEQFKLTYPDENLTNAQILRLRTDPERQEAVNRTFTEGNIRALQAENLQVNYGTLYAMHHFGQAGGIRFLRARSEQSVASVFTADAMAANDHFYNGSGANRTPKTKGQLWALIRGKMGQ